MSSSYKTGAFTTDLLRRQKLVQLNDKYSPSLLELSRCSSQLSEDDSPPEKSSGSPVSPNQTIPSYLPDVWADDLRMNALFTDFRPREVNPAAYDSKLKFWMDVIDRCVRHEELISFTSAQLRDKLQRKGKMPHCFPKVLEDMHRSKRFLTVDEYFSSSQESWLSWGFDMVKKPLWWSAGLVLGVNAVDGNQSQFVDVSIVKSKAIDVLDRANSGILPSSAVDLATFKEVFGDIVTEAAIPLVLKHLERTKQVIVTDLDNPEHATIKFLSPSSSSGGRDKRTTAGISETDRGLIALRRSLQKLEFEATVMQNKIQELDVEVRSLLRAGQKPAALRVLKKKKLVEKALSQKDNVVTNIGEMLFRLENSESDEKVFNAYKTGLSALKKAQEDTSLEKIEGIVDDMQEAVDVQAEIAGIISSPLKGTEDDNEALEKELTDLLEDDVTTDLISELEKLHVVGGDPSPEKQQTPNKSRTTRNKPGKS